MNCYINYLSNIIELYQELGIPFANCVKLDQICFPPGVDKNVDVSGIYWTGSYFILPNLIYSNFEYYVNHLTSMEMYQDDWKDLNYFKWDI